MKYCFAQDSSLDDLLLLEVDIEPTSSNQGLTRRNPDQITNYCFCLLLLLIGYSGFSQKQFLEIQAGEYNRAETPIYFKLVKQTLVQ